MFERFAGLPKLSESSRAAKVDYKYVALCYEKVRRISCGIFSPATIVIIIIITIITIITIIIGSSSAYLLLSL